MRTRVQRWGNSLGLRIPSAFAREAHIEENSDVELTLVDGKLVVAAVGELSLQALLAGVTEKNLHREFDTGPGTGNEAW